MNQNLICLEESKFGRKIPYTFLNSCDSEQCDCCQRVAIYLRGGFLCHNLSAHEYTNLSAMTLKVCDLPAMKYNSVLAVVFILKGL